MNPVLSSSFKISEVSVKNFRAFDEVVLPISGDLVFLTGANGSGKTSLLEAIALCSTLRSFRSSSDADIIRWDTPFYTTTVTFANGQKPQKLHVAYGKTEASQRTMHRRLLVNREKVTRISEFIGRLPTVVFSPDDLSIIDTNPAERRRFLDMLLSSLYPVYFEALQQYNRTLKQRALLLRQQVTNQRYFLAIDAELSAHGSIIQEKREQFIREYQNPFAAYVRQISNEKDTWVIAYRPSIPDGSNKQNYASALEKSLSVDQRVKMTLKGVHRDRIVFHPPKRENLELQQIASQGQKRTVALSLKMAQYAYVRSMTGSNPVLLVDDVLNELDIDRRKAFIGFLKEIGQAIITTTDVSQMQGFIEERKATAAVEVFSVTRDSKGFSKVDLQ